MMILKEKTRKETRKTFDVAIKEQTKINSNNKNVENATSKSSSKYIKTMRQQKLTSSPSVYSNMQTQKNKNLFIK